MDYMNKEKKIRLILRQLNGEATNDELQYLNEWLLESSDNFDFFLEIKTVWNTSMTEEIDFNSDKALDRIHRTLKKESRMRKFLQHSQSIAASLIIITLLAAFAFYQVQDQVKKTLLESTIVHQITKVSNAGEQLRLSLPDGSVVRLNAGSSIQFPERFETKERKVVLTGEAFFDVTKDPNRPFIVFSNYVQTTVLGTSFNIRAFKGKNISVTVATGIVKVAHLNKDKSFEVQLLPNEQVVYKRCDDSFNINHVDSQDYCSWINGVLKFNDENLADVALELERWFNVSIEIKNIESVNLKVNGSFKGEKLYNILDGLSYMYNLKYEYKNDRSILIKNK